MARINWIKDRERTMAAKANELLPRTPIAGSDKPRPIPAWLHAKRNARARATLNSISRQGRSAQDG